MPIRNDLLDLYHEYLAVTSHPAAAAALCIMDLFSSGQPAVERFVSGESPNVQKVAFESKHDDPVVIDVQMAPAVGQKADEWDGLLKAYRKLKAQE